MNIVLGNDVPGYLSRAELSTEEVDIFLGNKGAPEGDTELLVPDFGQVWTDNIDKDEDILDGEKTRYSRYIYTNHLRRGKGNELLCGTT